MKNLLIILLTITASIICKTEVTAQYLIPSYDVEIVADPTCFEEGTSQSNFVTPAINRKPLFIQMPGSDEERKMNVWVRPIAPQQSASASIKIYSLDGENTLGPFNITSSAVFEQTIDEREWGVIVVSASEGSEMDVWID